jgi:hypothetical protein
VDAVDHLGGYEPPRIGEGPRVAVFADGRIRLGVRYEGEQEVVAQLEPAEVQALLRFAILDHDLFAFDETSVDVRMHAECGLGVDPLPVPDAPETVVRIRLADREKTIRQRALDFAVLRYPTIRELAHLKAVSERLENVMAIASMGAEALKSTIESIVNPKLAVQALGARPFSIDEAMHLLRLRSAINGNRTYLIERKACGTPPDGYALVSVLIDPSRQEPVTIDSRKPEATAPDTASAP